MTTYVSFYMPKLPELTQGIQLDYDNIVSVFHLREEPLPTPSQPSVVFSEPPCGSCGLVSLVLQTFRRDRPNSRYQTEPEARAKYGDDKVKIYQSRFGTLSGVS